MKKIIWEVQYLSLPLVFKYCKKCGKKTDYICSGQFRINAQRKCLDIWLIYKCLDCDATWNLTIYSRINPQKLNKELLEQFFSNDSNLVEQYAMDIELLRKNAVEIIMPEYKIIGDTLFFDESVQLHIKSKYPLPIKVSVILREKLSLSQKDFENMLIYGQIKSHSDIDVRKCKLNKEIILTLYNTQKI